jgi:hypothetical protein
MSQLAIVPVLSGVAVTFFGSFVVLTPNGNFWNVPLLHSVSDVPCQQNKLPCIVNAKIKEGVVHDPNLREL